MTGRPYVSFDPAVYSGLERYLLARWEQQAARVEAVLRKLTKRERALVREVAVMAYVRGTVAAGGGPKRIPSDTVVVAEAVSACLSMPDLYPTLARIDRRIGGGPK